MQLKISSKWSLLAISIIGITLSSIVIVHGASIQSVQSIIYPTFRVLRTPVRLMIPKINVDAPIEDLGVTSSGAMAVPKGPSDVAWFDLGIFPGEKGSAVIAGHDGWKDNIQAVFDNLYRLQKGDKIYVEDNTGTTITFVARAVEIYDENANASSVFTSNDGLAHLNLITCEGVWNPSTKSYSGRLVVFADEEIK